MSAEAAGQSSDSAAGYPRGRSVVERFCKRMIDIVGAIFCLVCTCPLSIAIAIAIKLDDGGPVFYRRRVLGVEGEFDAYKFRTMRVDADKALEGDPHLKARFEQNFKMKDDPRITRLGAFLRRFSLDEIPQFLNVFVGQMSLVGPRMITRPELAKYGAAGHRLLSTKPGLTGYWQVNGRQNVDYNVRVRMDLFYIENWSLLMDLQILLRTPLLVLKAEGSY